MQNYSEHGPPITRMTLCRCGQRLPIYTAEMPEEGTVESARRVRLGWKCGHCGHFEPCKQGETYTR